MQIKYGKAKVKAFLAEVHVQPNTMLQAQTYNKHIVSITFINHILSFLQTL